MSKADEEEFLKNQELLRLIPQSEQDRVFNQRVCDISPYFIGFIETYKYLSLLIPKHFTVVDFGCAYNPQCYFFLNHKHYFAVDLPGTIEVFKSENCTYYSKGTKSFIDELLSTLNLKETFAICNYVPPWGGYNSSELVRKHFVNCHIYYPHGGYNNVMKLE